MSFKLNSELPGRQGKKEKLGYKEQFPQGELHFSWYCLLDNTSYAEIYFCKKILWPMTQKYYFYVYTQEILLDIYQECS